MGSNNTTDKKMYLIQICRGFAAILVLLFHLTELFHTRTNYNYLGGIFNQGNSGVDFFFVLSGFIIFYIHYKDIGDPERLKPFLIKRFIRVYPIYWAVLLLIIPIYFFIPLFGDDSIRNSISVLRAFTLIPFTKGPAPFLVVAWSMSYEVLFYLLFSILISFKRRTSYIVMFTWAVLTFLFVFQVPYAFGLPNNYILNFLFNAFNFEFMAGCIIAYILINKRILNYGKNMIIIGIILYVFSCAIQQIYSIDLISIRYLLYGIPFAFIIAGAALNNISLKNKTLKFMYLLGDASYSIYLTHYPVIWVLFKVISVIGVFNYIGYFFTATLIVIFTIASGCIFHLIIEKPLLKILRSRLLRMPSKIHVEVIT